MTTDLRTVLAAADPLRHDRHDRYDDAALTRRAREILAERGAGGAEPDLVVTPARPARPDRPDTPDRPDRPDRPARNATVTRRRAALAVVVAAVLAAAIAAVPALVGEASREHREAAALLDRAAHAVTAVDPPARADQYWRITGDGFALLIVPEPDGEFSSVLVTQSRTTYVAVDGSRPTVVVAAPGRVLRQVGGPPIAPAEVLGGDTPGTQTLPAPNASDPTWGTPSPAFLQALPRDPAALLERIRSDTAGQGSSADGEVVVTVADVLRSGLVPADLRAALYLVLARVPGVVVSDEHASVGGSSGIAFAFDEAVNGIRQELVVDPATGVLVGERQVTTRDVDGMPAGTVILEASGTRSLVDAAPAA